MTEPTPGILATQRPSVDVVTRALRHLAHGVMAHAKRANASLSLPSGNGGPAHTVTRDGDTLTCSCLAGQKGQACWAVATYQIISGLAAQWEPEQPPHYQPIDEHVEASPSPAHGRGGQGVRATPPTESAPTTFPKEAPLTATQRGRLSKILEQLNSAEIIEPKEGRKVAWFGRTGFGVHINHLDQATEEMGQDSALTTFATVLAATHVRNNGHCSGCRNELKPFSTGKNLSCWRCGIVVPNPAAEQAA